MNGPDQSDSDLSRTRIVTHWTAGATIADRFLLREELGEGGFGTVWLADDLLTGNEVAVKALKQASDSRKLRFQRETRALAVLAIPGVVRFVSSGTSDTTPFLAMERVRGEHFPGIPSPASWEQLETRVISLIETLSRIHASGVVHRDLKPSNILVDDRGTPVVLDFGLAWGPELGARMTAVGGQIGTASYLAPEQVGGSPIDPRSDLFSLGVLLFESLSGRLPYSGKSADEIQRAKLDGPPPLRRALQEAPAHIQQLIRQLLQPAPHERPPSAKRVLEAIVGSSEGVGESYLRWIGSREPIEQAVAGLRDGEFLTITGSPGTGKTRFLWEIEKELLATESPIARTTPGQAPYQSLLPVIGSVAEAEVSLHELTEEITARLTGIFAEGTVLLVDDFERIDPRSQQMLESIARRGSAPIARTMASNDDDDGFHLRPFQRIDLQQLFAGPERVVHLQSDAATQLYHRTSGVPALVFEEIYAWERAGICRRDGDRWKIDRAQLDRLCVGFERTAGLRIGISRVPLSRTKEEILAWLELAYPQGSAELLCALMPLPLWELEGYLEDLAAGGLVRPIPNSESGAPTNCWASVLMGFTGRIWDSDQRQRAHAKIAAALPARADHRYHHLVLAYSSATGRSAEVVDEAIAEASRLFSLGFSDLAVIVIEQALQVLETDASTGDQIRLLKEWASLVGSVGPRSFQPLRSELRQRIDWGAEVNQLILFIDALELAKQVGGHAPISTLRQMRFDHGRLEHWRMGAMAIAASVLDTKEELSLLKTMESQVVPDSDAHLRVVDWLGRSAYRRLEFRESAELHLQAARSCSGVPRVSSLINATRALLELGEFDAARTAQSEAVNEANSIRYPSRELWVYHLDREICARSRVWSEPSGELITLAEDHAEPSLRASILLFEGVHSWRVGHLEEAGRLWSRSAEAYARIGQGLPAALVRLTRGAFATEAVDPEEVLEDWKTLSECSIPGFQMQGWALAKITGMSSAPSARLRSEWRTQLSSYPESASREILSLEECFEQFAFSSSD